MCGIAGFISQRGEQAETLRKMTDIIKHRGPDDEGFVLFEESALPPYCLGGENTPQNAFESPLSYAPTEDISSYSDLNVQIGLGHRRLSILDLSVSGHQPMSTADQRYWIIYNGEVYNYLEIREELSEKGYQFVSDTDTEVVLAAYQEWGEECLSRFNGMWAIVIYDSLKQEVFIARDRFGIKPLYYWYSPDGTLYWGSEIKQFTVCDGWEARVNPQRAYDYLLHSLTDHSEETMFDGVYHIPPGHYLKSGIKELVTGENKQLPVKRWFAINRNKKKLDLDIAGEQFEHFFKKSVRMHLRSDVPVGSALSGGLDSSAIVCEINSLLRKENKDELQKTFSSVAENEAYSEKKWMDIVVEETQVDAHFTYPDLNNLFDLTSEILWHQDEPYQSQSVYLGYHVFQLAQNQNVKVLLNGQGADEYLGGYGQNRAATQFNLLKSLRWFALYQEYKATMDGNLKQFLRSLFINSIPDSLKDFLKQKVNLLDVERFIDREKLGADTTHPYDTMAYDSETFDLSSIDDITRLHLFHNPLPRYLRWEDRNSMAHSIEARVPFLDYELVEYTCNLPHEHIYKNGVTKLVMRNGLDQVLPEKIANRKDKKGFITPEEQWVKENPDLFREKLEEAIEVTNGIIKPEALDYFDQVAKGEKPFNYTYWRLIQFSEWIKVFDVKL